MKKVYEMRRMRNFIIFLTVYHLPNSNKWLKNYICRNSGTWGSPDAVKVGPPHVGPPGRHSRPRHKTGIWAPHLPHGAPAHAASTTKARDSGTLRGPLDPEAGVEVPETPTPGRRPDSFPGTNLQRAMRISLPAPAGSS